MAFCVEINPNGNTIKHGLVLQLYFLQEKDDGMWFAHTLYIFNNVAVVSVTLIFFHPSLRADTT